MGCIAEVMASVSDVDFQCKKEAQKYLIEFILVHSNYDLKALAEVLDTNALLLSHVVSGRSYLEGNAKKRLNEWFVLLFDL